MEKQTERGVLKYRMPNILESYDILEASGITEGKPSQLKLKRNIIAGMGFLIDCAGIEGQPTYEELLNDSENMIIPLGEIADEVIVKAFSAFKKKDYITDAIGVVKNKLTKEQLYDLISAPTKEEQEERINGVWETRKDVLAYWHYQSAIDLGLSVSLNDLPFEKAMIFSWIKGAYVVRKT